MTTLKLSAAKPYWVWSITGGFQFFATQKEQEEFVLAAESLTGLAAGVLPVEETAQPEPVRMLALCPKAAPIASLPAKLFAALQRFSAEHDHRKALVDRVEISHGHGYATDGSALVHISSDDIKTTGFHRLLIHINRKQLRRGLLAAFAEVQVMPDLSVRIMHDGVVTFVGPSLAKSADPSFPNIAAMLEKSRADATVPGLNGAANPSLLSRVAEAADVAGFTPAAILWRSGALVNGSAISPFYFLANYAGAGAVVDGLVMPMSVDGKSIAQWWTANGWTPPVDPEPNPAAVSMPAEAAA